MNPIASPTPRPKQITLAEAMVLISACSVGLLMARTAQMINLWPWNHPLTWIFIFYAALAGINMTGVVLMLVDRLRHKRRWGLGAVLFFAGGLISWYCVPKIVAIQIVQSGRFATIGQFLYSKTYLAEGLSVDSLIMAGWPMVSLVIVVACLVGGQLRRLNIRRWWPEWLGMFMVIAWAIPGVYLFYDMLAKR